MKSVRFDWIAILALSLIAMHPIFQSNLPNGSDVGIHYWRTFEWEQNWGSGDYLGLWGEHFYYGYGYPFFQYYAGGSYALATILGWLPGVDDIWRIKAVWALGLFLTVAGAYWFGQARFGVWGGLVMSAAWVFAPTVIFGEPIARASMPAVLAMGFWATSLALLDRVIRHNLFFLLACLSTAALLWSHNVTAAMGIGTLFGWLAWQSLFNRANFPHWQKGWLVLLIAMALTAFFWLPFWAARDDVALARLYAVDNLDFRSHFQPIEQLFTLVPRYDSHLIGQKSFYQLGIASAYLGIIGAGLLLWQLARRQFSAIQREGVFWLIFGFGLIFFLTPYSIYEWEFLSFLSFLQFPTRLLNAAAIPLAWFAGSLALQWPKTNLLWAFALVMLAWQGFQATAWGQTKPEEYRPHATVADYFDYEIRNHIPATTGTNEFLPRTVIIPPPPSEFLLTSLSQGDVAMRLNPHVFPETTIINATISKPTRYEFDLESLDPLELEIYLFYFQGWTGWIDNKPIRLAPVGQHGFIGIPVTAGRHHIALKYQMNPWHKIGLAISGLGLLGLLGLSKSFSTASRMDSPVFMRSDQLLFAGAIIIALLGSPFALATGRTESPLGEARLADHTFQANFDDQISLLGYDFERPLDSVWQISLYWSFAADVRKDLNLFVHVLAPDGNVIRQYDELHFSRITRYHYWEDDFYYRSHFQFWFDEPLPAGDYQIRVGFWQGDNPTQPDYLSAYDEQEASLGDFVWLPETVSIK